MDRYSNDDSNEYNDYATVESQRNDLIPAEYPEGPYRSDLSSVSLGKSKPWRINQRMTSAFGYENEALYAGISQEYPGEDDAASVIPEVIDEP